MATVTEIATLPEIRHTECFIGGRWVPASDGKTFPTINPATEEVIAQIAEGTAEDVDHAVRAARDAFEDAAAAGEAPRVDFESEKNWRQSHAHPGTMRTSRSGRGWGWQHPWTPGSEQNRRLQTRIFGRSCL